MNFTTLLEVILFGAPYKCTTSQKNKYAIVKASLVFVHKIKYTILENLSTTTRIVSRSVLYEAILTQNLYTNLTKCCLKQVTMCIIRVLQLSPTFLANMAPLHNFTNIHLYSIVANNISLQQAPCIYLNNIITLNHHYTIYKEFVFVLIMRYV